MKNNSEAITHENYVEFLTQIKHEITTARVQVARTANKGLIKLYWNLGKNITEKQSQLGWGKSVVEQLAKDLQKTFGGRSGFLTQNLWYMRQFYQAYCNDKNLQQLVGEIPWGQNLVIMAKYLPEALQNKLPDVKTLAK